MIGHGNKKGMSLREMARSKGKETYQGKRCGCGCTSKKVSSGRCVDCKGNFRQQMPRSEKPKVKAALLAHRAFNLAIGK